MINGICSIFKTKKEPLQLPDDVVNAVVLMLRDTLIIGFVLGAISMVVIHSLVN